MNKNFNRLKRLEEEVEEIEVLTTNELRERLG